MKSAPRTIPSIHDVYVNISAREYSGGAFPRQTHSTERLTVSWSLHIFNLMVEQSAHALDRVFQALADPTRRAILRRLASESSTVSELAAPYDMSLAAVSKHLRVLERAGLVEREVRGRVHHLRLRPEQLEDAWDWIAYYERYWNERLDVLERVVLERRNAKSEKHRKEKK